MADTWQFHAPVRVVSGNGASASIGRWTPEGRVLLVTTAGFTRRGVTADLLRALPARDVVVFDGVTPNPDLDTLDIATARLRPERVGGIVAVGGGSAIDTAKVLALTLPAALDRPLHRVLREAQTVAWDTALPVVAVPTTAGTGAEVTPFATVWDHTAGRKHSLAHEFMWPRHAVLDPRLTLTLPRHETLNGGLDTLAHALESLWNRNRTPVSESLSLHALALATTALEDVLEHPHGIGPRARMQQASLLAGLAISQTRTAIAHAISYPLTARHGVPHGLACGFTLSAIIDAVSRFEPCTQFHLPMREAQALLRRLDLPTAVARHVSRPQVLALLDEMVAPGRSENFVIDVTRDDLAALVAGSLQAE